MTKIKFMTQKVFLLSLVFITQLAYGQSKYGADENAYGAITILVVGILGMAYVLSMVKSRDKSMSE